MADGNLPPIPEAEMTMEYKLMGTVFIAGRLTEAGRSVIRLFFTSFVFVTFFVACNVKTEPAHEIKSVTRGGTALWPKGILVYDDLSLSVTLKRKVARGADLINSETDIRIIDLSTARGAGYPTNFVMKVFNDPDMPPGAAAYVTDIGYSKGLKMGISPKTMVGSIAHEFMHALGIHHEQINARAFQIKTNNMISSPLGINQYSRYRTIALSAEDLNSIMHYGSFAFSLCFKPYDPKWSLESPENLPPPQCKNIQAFKSGAHTLAEDGTPIDCLRECATFLDKSGNIVNSQREHLSNGDIQGINRLYASEIARRDADINENAMPVCELKNGRRQKTPDCRLPDSEREICPHEEGHWANNFTPDCIQAPRVICDFPEGHHQAMFNQPGCVQIQNESGPGSSVDAGELIRIINESSCLTATPFNWEELSETPGPGCVWCKISPVLGQDAHLKSEECIGAGGTIAAVGPPPDSKSTESDGPASASSCTETDRAWCTDNASWDPNCATKCPGVGSSNSGGGRVSNGSDSSPGSCTETDRAWCTDNASWDPNCATKCPGVGA